MFHPHVRRTAPTKLALDALEARDCPAIAVRLDFQFDTSHFFDDPAKRQALQRAVDAIAPRLQDHLAAITPNAANSWKLTFPNPGTGGAETVVNPSIGADEVVVYVMGASLPGNLLGRSLPWSYTSVGPSDWNALLKGRGQPGATASVPTDVGPWGGAVAFDTRANWNFGTGLPAANQFDFLSVAEHELMHVFGFGADDPAFTRWVNSTDAFTGPNVVAVFGAPAPVVRDQAGGYPDHWAQATTVGGRAPVMVPVLPMGARQTATALDFAALKDVGWQVSPPTLPVVPVLPPPAPANPPPVPSVPPAPPTPSPLGPQGSTPIPSAPRTSPVPTIPPPPIAPRAVIGVGYSANGRSTLDGLSSTGQILFSIPTGTGGTGVSVASADFNGDGIDDWVVGSGPGVQTLVRILDGRTFAEIAAIRPFEPSFTGGVNVSVGDLTGDGRPELIVTPDDGGGPRVRVFDPSVGFASIADFFGIEDSSFRGGARSAVGDVNGDGVADLLVAAGLGGGPRVAAFDGRTLKDPIPQKLFGDFFAADSTLRDGVHLAAGDFNADGFADVLVGAVGAGSQAVLLNGRDLAQGRVVVWTALASGVVGPHSGAQVLAADVDGSGKWDAVVGSEGDGRVIAYRGNDFAKMFDVSLFPGQIVPISVG